MVTTNGGLSRYGFLHLCHPPSQLVEPVRDDGSACRADERERLSNV
jgi:hypothetical protein